MVIMTIDLTLAMATPIGRTVREDRHDREEFVEDVVPRIPAATAVYAAPGFLKQHASFSLTD
jgi:hypothetical protein